MPDFKKGTLRTMGCMCVCRPSKNPIVLTLPLFLLAASPALACKPGSGSLIDNLPLLLVFLLLQPVTWVVLFGLLVVAVTIADASRNARGSQSTRTLR